MKSGDCICFHSVSDFPHTSLDLATEPRAPSDVRLMNVCICFHSLFGVHESFKNLHRGLQLGPDS